MANTRLTKVEIGGVDVSTHLMRWSINQNFGNPIDSADLVFARTITDDVTLDNSQLVEIWAGYTTSTDLKMFSGYIEKYEPDVGVIKVKAFSKLYAAVRNLISATIYDKDVVASPIYPDGKYSDAFYDIVTTHAGLSATNGVTIQDSGTTRFITKMICYQTDPKERMDKIAEALQWIYYYRPDTDKVYFEPKQTTVNSTVLTIGDNVVNVPKWKYDKTDLINDLRVDGAVQEKLIEDLFTGDSSTQSFTLSQVPTGDVSLYYSNTVNLVSNPVLQSYGKTLGVSGSTSTAYDYTVDKSTRKISTVGSGGGGFTASSNTNNILASYVASVAVPIHKLDQPSIDSYTAHKRQMTLSDVITVADAESRASEILEKFKNPFQSATLNVKHTSGYSFKVGDSIRVVDSLSTPAVDDYLTIWGITYQYPGGFDELMVGDREFDPPEFFLNISDRLNALDKELFDSSTVLTELRSFTMDGTIEPHSLTITEQYINDSFILDHPINGVVYTSTEAFILDDFESAASWTSATLTLTDDSTSGHYWVGSQGVNCQGTGFGVFTLNKTVSYDLSSISGASTGLATRGTIGIWMYGGAESDSVPYVYLRVRSSVGNLQWFLGETYQQRAGFESTFSIPVGERRLVLFDLNDPSTVTGTLNWASVTNLLVEFDYYGVDTFDITLDYLTGSKSDDISLCGLGDRITQKSTVTTNY